MWFNIKSNTQNLVLTWLDTRNDGGKFDETSMRDGKILEGTGVMLQLNILEVCALSVNQHHSQILIVEENTSPICHVCDFSLLSWYN